LLIACSLPLVFANGEGSHDEGFGDDDGHDEMMEEMVSGHSMGGSGMTHQLQMILPFSHFGEGHWFAGIMLVLMWLSLVYVGYDLFTKKK